MWWGQDSVSSFLLKINTMGVSYDMKRNVCSFPKLPREMEDSCGSLRQRQRRCLVGGGEHCWVVGEPVENRGWCLDEDGRPRGQLVKRAWLEARSFRSRGGCIFTAKILKKKNAILGANVGRQHTQIYTTSILQEVPLPQRQLLAYRKALRRSGGGRVAPPTRITPVLLFHIVLRHVMMKKCSIWSFPSTLQKAILLLGKPTTRR